MKPNRPPRTARKTVIYVAAIVAAFFIGDRCLSALADATMSRSRSALALTYNGKLDQQIWIIGNSRAIKSFNSPLLSQQTGKSAINLGTNGIRPAMLHAFLSDAVAANERPETVLIEVSYLKNDWDDSQGAEFLPFIHRGKRTRQVLHGRISKEATAAEWFHLRRYGSQQFFRSLSYLSSDDQGAAPRRSITAEAIKAAADRDPEEFPFHQEDVAQLKSILDALQQNGVRVELILAPYLKTYLDRIVDLDDWVQQIERETGRTVFDQSNAIASAEFFTDHVHLNRDGQAKFTETVANFLK